jgi:hypothetical protein
MPLGPTLSHQHASGLIPSTYTEWRLSGKLKKITQRLYFGYCQEGFREFVGEKCENRKGRERDSRSGPAILLTPNPFPKTFHAIDA